MIEKNVLLVHLNESKPKNLSLLSNRSTTLSLN